VEYKAKAKVGSLKVDGWAKLKAQERRCFK